MVQKVVTRKVVLWDKSPQSNFRLLSFRERADSIQDLNKC